MCTVTTTTTTITTNTPTITIGGGGRHLVGVPSDSELRILGIRVRQVSSTASMAGEASNPPTVFFPLYKPPISTLSKQFNKPRARARRSARIFYIFPYNCRSRIPAPTDSNSVRARFWLAKKKPSSILLPASPADSPQPHHISYARSQQGLGIWRFLFFTMIATSHRSNSNLVVTAHKRKLPRHYLQSTDGLKCCASVFHDCTQLCHQSVVLSASRWLLEYLGKVGVHDLGIVYHYYLATSGYLP